MSARERVREVGVLRTRWFKPGGIMPMMRAESVLISLAGRRTGLLPMSAAIVPARHKQA